MDIQAAAGSKCIHSAEWLHGLQPDARTVADFRAAFVISAAAANVPACQLAAELSVFDDIPTFWRLPGDITCRPDAGGVSPPVHLMLPGIWKCIASMPSPAIARLVDLSRVVAPLPREEAKEALSRLLPPLLQDIREYEVSTQAVAELLPWLLNSFNPDADVFVYSTFDCVCTVVRVGMNADIDLVDKQLQDYKPVDDEDGFLKHMRSTAQIGRVCFWCESAPTKGRLRACGGCNKVLYCSQNCQQIDWRAQHRDECKLKSTTHHSNGETSISALEIDLRTHCSRLQIETGGKRGFVRILMGEANDLEISRAVSRNRRGDEADLATGWMGQVLSAHKPILRTVSFEESAKLLAPQSELKVPICRPAAWLHGIEPDARTVADFKAAFVVSAAAANVPAGQLAAELSVFDSVPEFWNLPGGSLPNEAACHRPDTLLMLPGIWMCIASMPTPAIERVIALTRSIIPLSHGDSKSAFSRLLPPLLQYMHEHQISTAAVAELLQWLLNSFSPDADAFIFSTVDRVCTVVRVDMDADMDQIEKQIRGSKFVGDADGFVALARSTTQIGRVCFWCESAPTKGPLLPCGGCNKLLYCSPRCQERDLDAEHHYECKLKATVHHPHGAISVPAAKIDLSICPTRLVLETTKNSAGAMFTKITNVQGLLIMRAICRHQSGMSLLLPTGWICRIHDPSEQFVPVNTIIPTAVSILQKASEGSRARPEVMRALKHLQKMSSRARFSANQFPIVKISPNFFKKYSLKS